MDAVVLREVGVAPAVDCANLSTLILAARRWSMAWPRQRGAGSPLSSATPRRPRIPSAAAASARASGTRWRATRPRAHGSVGRCRLRAAFSASAAAAEERSVALRVRRREHEPRQPRALGLGDARAEALVARPARVRRRPRVGALAKGTGHIMSQARVRALPKAGRRSSRRLAATKSGTRLIAPRGTATKRAPIPRPRTAPR